MPQYSRSLQSTSWKVFSSGGGAGALRPNSGTARRTFETPRPVPVLNQSCADEVPAHARIVNAIAAKIASFLVILFFPTFVICSRKLIACNRTKIPRPPSSPSIQGASALADSIPARREPPMYLQTHSRSTS